MDRGTNGLLGEAAIKGSRSRGGADLPGGDGRGAVNSARSAARAGEADEADVFAEQRCFAKFATTIILSEKRNSCYLSIMTPKTSTALGVPFFAIEGTRTGSKKVWKWSF
jgi:hypothetical protein